MGEPLTDIELGTLLRTYSLDRLEERAAAEIPKLRRKLNAASSPRMSDYGPDTPKDELLLVVNATRGLEDKNTDLRKKVSKLAGHNGSLSAENEILKADNAKLREQRDESRETLSGYTACVILKQASLEDDNSKLSEALNLDENEVRCRLVLLSMSHAELLKALANPCNFNGPPCGNCEACAKAVAALKEANAARPEAVSHV